MRNIKVKVHHRTDHKGPQGEQRYSSTLPFNLSSRWRWVVNTMSWPVYVQGKTWYPLYRRLSGPQGQSGRVWKISPPPRFNPRTVQSIASCYTD
jgi:hypothetical protein